MQIMLRTQSALSNACLLITYWLKTQVINRFVIINCYLENFLFYWLFLHWKLFPIINKFSKDKNHQKYFNSNGTLSFFPKLIKIIYFLQFCIICNNILPTKCFKQLQIIYFYSSHKFHQVSSSFLNVLTFYQKNKIAQQNLENNKKKYRKS